MPTPKVSMPVQCVVVMSFDIVQGILHRYIYGMSISRVVSWYHLQSTATKIIVLYV